MCCLAEIIEVRTMALFGKKKNKPTQEERILDTKIQLEKLKETLKIHGADLREAYAQAKQAGKMKTAFLHNMTNQMIAPAEKIRENVQTLSDSSKIKKQEASQLVANIQEEGNFIAELLNNLLRVSNDMGKEASHD